MYKVGDKIKFKREKQRYAVQARDDRYLICTKPFNAKKTVIYTIVDMQEKIRGTDNMVFCNGYETKQQCEDALFSLQNEEIEISFRNRIALDIENK